MKITKQYLRKVIKEELDNLMQEAADPLSAKAIEMIDKAPGLQQALDKLQNEDAAGPVLSHFIQKLTAKGMNKSKLVNMMTSQFKAAKDVKSGQVGKGAPPQ